MHICKIKFVPHPLRHSLFWRWSRNIHRQQALQFYNAISLSSWTLAFYFCTQVMISNFKLRNQTILKNLLYDSKPRWFSIVEIPLVGQRYHTLISWSANDLPVWFTVRHTFSRAQQIRFVLVLALWDLQIVSLISANEWQVWQWPW